MQSPVVPFHDPTAAKQRAKLSQEGSYIPIFINISIMKKNLPLEHRINLEKRELKKSQRASMAGFLESVYLSAFHLTGPDPDSCIDR
jgi:hypothetical protein